MMDTEPVVLHRNSAGDDWVCEHGEIHELHTRFHGGQPGRPCIHANPDGMPVCILIGTDIVMAMGWQPVVYTQRGYVGIYSRVDDRVCISVDHTRPVEGCNNGQGSPLVTLNPDRTWCYRLFPVRFDDQEEVRDDILIGVRTITLEHEGV